MYGKFHSFSINVLPEIRRFVLISRLRWDILDDHKPLDDLFDVVIAADCVFKTEYHKALCICMRNIIKDDVMRICIL